jgi:two-component system cell cycle sensor histidine kinase/response regulator CckA
MAKTMPQPVRVLIVEDSATDAELMVLELRRDGIESTWKRVHSAEELTTALTEQTWDVVLSDYTVPGFGAVAALSIVRTMASTLPFIVVSGSVGEDLAVEMMRAGANDYVLKHAMSRLGPAVNRELREAERRRAAERLSENVLNSLPAHIAVLNREGTIVAVNTAWKIFSARYKNLDQAGPGWNFLEIGCLAQGPYAAAASQIIDGVGDVLSGRQPQFALEYQCRATTPFRWFLVNVTPLGAEAAGAVISHTDITPCKVAEEALRESEERYRLLLDRIPAPVIVYDRETLYYLAVNDAAITNYGYSRDEFLKLKITDISPPEDVPALLDMLARRETTFEQQGNIWRHRRKDGSTIQVEVTAHSLELNGRPACIVLSTDVTERMRTEAEIRGTRDLLKAVTDSSPDAIFVKDLQGRYLLFNPAASRFVGLPIEDVLGRHDSQLFDSVSAQIVMQRDRRVIESAQTETEEEKLTAAGVTRVYLATKTPYWDGQGNIAGVIGISRDITDRKRAEEELILFRALVDQTSDAIEVIDPQTGQYLDVNETACLTHGYTRQEYLSLKVADIDPIVAKSPWSQIVSKREESGSRIFEGQHRRKDGSTFPVEVNLNYVHLERDYLLAVVRDITERKRAEEALRISEERFRAFMDHSPAAAWITDPDGRIVYLSGAYRKIFLTPEGDLTGKLPSELFPESIARLYLKNIQTVAKSGKVMETTEPGIRPDGSAGEFLVYKFLITHPEGGDAVGGVALDVTEQRRAEAALQQSEQRFRAIFNSMFQFTGVLSTDGILLEVNQTALAAVDLTAEEVVGRPFWDCPWWSGSPKSRSQLQDTIRRAAAGELVRYEVDIRGVNNRIISIDFSLKPVFDESGRVTFLIPEGHDVTDKKRAESDLRLRDRAMRAVTQGILITDAGQSENPIIYASPGFEQLTGYHEAEVIGLNCRLLQGDDSDPATIAVIRQAIQAGERCTAELLNYRKDGIPFWNELSISPVRDANGNLTHFVGVLADVTARRRLEEQLRQSQKMEAVGQLAGGIAHDFNNLLTVIIGYSDVIHEMLERDHPAYGLINEILQAGERAASLTRQLLAFSRRQVLQPIELDLNAVTRELEKMLRRLVSEDIRLTTVLDPELWIVRADPGQIEQVIVNLVVNAKDAMPHGGRLLIETRNVQLDETYVRTQTELRSGDCVMLKVSDTGHGIPPDLRMRIFEPFFTTKEVGKGTGLGLATVHGILKQSGVFTCHESCRPQAHRRQNPAPTFHREETKQFC